MALLRIALAAVIVAGSLVAVGFTPELFIDGRVVGHAVGFFRQMIPPSLETRFVGSLGVLLLQTIAISVIGTLIGIVLGWVLALPATSTLALLPGDSPGLHPRVERAMRWAAYASARLVLNLLRSIPELVWVLICILAVGVGPFAGVIAIGWHTAGVLGKLYAETMEEAPRRAVDALRSMGVRPLQVLLWAIWPQTKSMLGSYTVLRWEMNLRVSTILGLVGGGGLGQAIYNNVQLGFYQRVGTLILLIYLLVIGTDWIGGRLLDGPLRLDT
jgi:phosphonate transport system permease protein